METLRRRVTPERHALVLRLPDQKMFPTIDFFSLGVKNDRSEAPPCETFRCPRARHFNS